MATALIKRVLGHQTFHTSIRPLGRTTNPFVRKAATATTAPPETYVPEVYHLIDSQKDHTPYKPAIHHNQSVGFVTREARYEDAEDLTRLWFSSSNFSSDIDARTYQWWNDVWIMGIQAGIKNIRTFVIEDRNHKIVAFSRWNVPQKPGLQSDNSTALPEFPDEWGAELTEALWGTVSRNRQRIMGQRPHWRCEFLAVDPSQQEVGLASLLLNWGCQQADAENLEVYVDRYITDLSVWKKEKVRFWSWDFMAAPYVYPDTKGPKLAAVVRPSKLTGAWNSSMYVRREESEGEDGPSVPGSPRSSR
ncbi:hypothetical protein TWF106_003557 [Orbilia oligospora]|uniref:N-acetyltransferase domain-containing protein n=1 Tax=Orbilia oligospora TaxID=2813651 RepID=A0A7C8Q7F6_ORBOL|nr:hypothetical protein TWF106_003557 [Orbilia oligospora]